MPSSRRSSDPGIEPTSLLSPALAGSFFTTSTTWEAHLSPTRSHSPSARVNSIMCKSKTFPNLLFPPSECYSDILCPRRTICSKFKKPWMMFAAHHVDTFQDTLLYLMLFAFQPPWISLCTFPCPVLSAGLLTIGPSMPDLTHSQVSGLRWSITPSKTTSFTCLA